MSQTDRTQQRTAPWGRVAAIFAACGVTLLGVFRGIDPDVILLRAACAAVALGVVVSVAISVLNWLTRLR